jgi:CubicO group peptidase (beta-lactamase class C family)
MTNLALLPFLVAPLFVVAPGQEPDLAAQLAARVARATEPCLGVEVQINLGADVLQHSASGMGVAGAARETDDLLRAPQLLRALTSLAVLRLVGTELPGGETKLDLDRAIGVFVPAAKFDGEPVTVRHLLAGTSGVAPYDAELNHEQRATASTKSLIDVVVASGLVSAPGHCFDPNESEVLLLGALVEAMTQKPLAAALGELFEAAGLESTAFLSEDEAPARVAGDVTFELDLDRLAAPALYPFGEDRLCTTVPDLVRLVRAIAGRELLDEATLAAFLTPQHVHAANGPATTTGFGLGVDLVRLGDFGGVTVGGGGVGGSLHVVRYPDADLTLVLAATSPDAPIAELGRDLARLVLGIPPPGVQDLELPAAQARRFVGGYLLGCNRLDLTRRDDGHLLLSTVDGPSRVLLYQGGVEFIVADCGECQFEFLFRDGEERASGVVLSEHGLRSEAVRID